ncbi:MAG: RNA 2',3'-cyclic phosphodiesterase [Fretibacterium sp.]|nr:RNA 2',3'-cyclic phosphodiesterase [Fretibacterium sp.]
MSAASDAGKKNSLVRAFVAVPVPDPAAVELERFLGILRPAAPLRWVTRAQFHITLRFLGEQTRETIDRVKEVLAPLRFDPFEIELSCAGAFPNKGRPRVLWLSGRQGREELTALAENVNSAINAAGLPPEERPFKPHLTLARSDGTPLPSALMKALENPPALAWRCEGFELMRSRLTPQGAVYSRIPLS